MKSKMTFISEEMKDINKFPFNVHHTNVESMAAIMKSGFLRGSDYGEIGTLHSGDREIATLRRSEDKNIASYRDSNPNAYKSKMRNLSMEIEDVKIYLYTDRIKAGARGIKKYPIAELNIYNEKRIRMFLTFLYTDLNAKKNGTPFNEFSKKLTDKIVSLMEMYEDGDRKIMSNQKLRDAISSWLRKEFKFKEEKSKDINFKFYDLFNSVAAQQNRLKNREGEERFRYKKDKDGIPVKPEFMKVRFLEFNKDYLKFYKEIFRYAKDEKIFFKDKVFKQIKSYIKSFEFK